MHLSQVIIRNYRSIEALSVRFTKGKNAIVGKNNSGKTNIISAINLVLGEYSPTYAKSQNVVITDFFQGDTSRMISIFCEITRDSAGEVLDYVEMGRETKGFYRCSSPIHLKTDGLEFPEDMLGYDSGIERVFAIDFDSPVLRKYIRKEAYSSEFSGVCGFGYLFSARLDESGRVCKDMRLLYRRDGSDEWVVANTSYLRNSLIQSMILPSFRDPYSQLRVSDYSWYGRLLRQSVSQVDAAAFEEARERMREVANGLFQCLTDQMNSGTEVAFPGTCVTIQCTPQSADVHKQALIYVDDGFESLLTDKGAGIQSSVIIGLFSYYVRNVASGSALLVVEEPELYLHPHGRRVVSRQFDAFLEDSRSQVIFTTHSPEFISGPRSDFTLIRVARGSDGRTSARNVVLSGLREVSLISMAQNAEIFFADAVILVEGVSDKMLVELVASRVGARCLGRESWLSECNVSVIPIEGKWQFPLYAGILERLGVHWFIFADFDFLREGCRKFLSGEGRCWEVAGRDIRDLDEILNAVGLQERREGCKVRYLSDVSDEGLRGRIRGYLEMLGSRYDVYVMEGDLEQCYTVQCRMLVDSVSGHDAWRPSKRDLPLYLIYRALPEGRDLFDLVVADRFMPLLCGVMRYFGLCSKE